MARRAAWGSVEEMVRGKKYRLRYWASTPEGYRRVSEIVYGTRTDAEDVRAQRRLDHGRERATPTARAAYERWWLPNFERRVAEGEASANSLTSFKSCWNKWCEPTWGAVEVSAIHPVDVQAWLLTMPISMARRARTIMTGVLDYCVRYELVPTNPFRAKYDMPSRSTSETMDRGIWTTAEVLRLCEAARGEWYEGALLVQAFGGTRVGEALGVMVEDVRGIDCDGVPVALVGIHRQVGNRGGVTGTLKTQQSNRVVPIPGPPGGRLVELADRCDAGWLTSNGLGSHVSQVVFRNAVLACAGKAGVERHQPRSLRNAWETRMRWEWGLPPYVVEPMMGHAGKDVTAQFYDRPSPEAMAQVVAGAYKLHPYDSTWDK
jgi:integrase